MVFGTDPAAQAALFEDAGCEWLHLVDLIALRDTGVIAGAISGRALHDGAIDLAQAIAALRP